MDGDKYQVEITHALATDSGCVTCRAANHLGESSAFSSLCVIPYNSSFDPDYKPSQYDSKPDVNSGNVIWTVQDQELTDDESGVQTSGSERPSPDRSDYSNKFAHLSNDSDSSEGRDSAILDDNPSYSSCTDLISRSVSCPSHRHRALFSSSEGSIPLSIHRTISSLSMTNINNSGKIVAAKVVEGPQSITVLRGEVANLRAHYVGNPDPNIKWVKAVS